MLQLSADYTIVLSQLLKWSRRSIVVILLTVATVDLFKVKQ